MALIVAGAVIVPLVVLFVSSFKVLDPAGWDTTWGFGNYVTMFTDRIIPKAFVNTLIISSGSTVLATLLGCFSGLDQRADQLPGPQLS